MKTSKGRSKKLIVYEDKRSGAIFLNPTKLNANGNFVMKSPPQKYGEAMGRTVSDADLGKSVKKALKQCD